MPPPLRYEFLVAEPMSETARAAFPELRAVERPEGTGLHGALVDEAHLHGILSRLFVMGFTVTGVRRLEG